MCIPGNSALSSTKEERQNKLLVTCYLLLDSVGYLVRSPHELCKSIFELKSGVRLLLFSYDRLE